MGQPFEISLECIHFSDDCAAGAEEAALRLAGRVVGVAGRAWDSEAVRYAEGQSQGRGEPHAVSLRYVDGPHPVSGAKDGADALHALFLINKGLQLPAALASFPCVPIRMLLAHPMVGRSSTIPRCVANPILRG